ncbi:MAG: LPS export ABC transporter periplasmic protein LptC [Candidatus Omnitrophota bacterium]
MNKRKFCLLFICWCLSFEVGILSARAAEVSNSANTTASDQQINDFSLVGYGEKGKKTWDLAGKSADIYTDTIKLSDVNGNMYGKEEDVNLTAKTGDFNKVDGKMHLEKDVVITTSKGTKLTTDSLDWDRKNQLVSTKDVVNIQRENMVIDAVGAKGEPNLKKVALEKDIKLDINPTEPAKPDGVKEKITITCDGPLDVDYELNVATFNNNVKVERPDSTIYSDKMEVFFGKSPNSAGASDSVAGAMGNKIDKIIAKGNVRLVKGENVSYSQEAIYSAADRKITLTGRPKLILYSVEEMNAPSAN